MHKLFLSFIFIFLSISSFSQTYWRIKNENNEELLLTIKIDEKNQTFKAHTRKDALKDIAGTFKYYAARTAGILKYPEIIHIEGKISLQGDTTLYSGTLIQYDDPFQFSGKTQKNKFDGKIVDTKGGAKLLQGEKVSSDKPLRDYASLIDKAFLYTEKYYYDRKLSDLSEWKDFKEKVDDIKSNISDDYEMNAVIYWYRKKLPLPKYEIQKNSIKKKKRNKEKSFAPKEIENGTMLVDISNIPDKKDDMKNFFIEIQNKQCTTLIIDMRGRKKIQLASALLLTNHLVDYSALWGAYLTQKGSNTFNPHPISVEHEKRLENFWNYHNANDKLYRKPGFYVKTEPAVPFFKGEVYLIIDSETSGVSEALAIFLKNEKIATTVGQKSSGSPMLIEMVSVDKDYYLSLQVAQFFARNGKSYKNKYIEPDRNVTDEDSLSYLLKMIN